MGDDPGGDGRGGGDPDVDPAELQRQLSEIKGAMGLEERYPGQRRMWPVYGAVMAVLLVALNASFTGYASARLPDWLYFWLFVGTVVAVALVQWRIASKASTGTASTPGPDFRVLLGTLFLAVLAFVVLTYPSIEVALQHLSQVDGARLEGATVYGAVIAIAGLGFLFTGNGLRAYRIRKRDRYVFYGAGLWMLAYGALMPHYEILGAIGYGLFGVLFFGYSVVAYLVLGRSGDER